MSASNLMSSMDSRIESHLETPIRYSPVRKKVFKHSLTIIILYSLVGIFMMLTLVIAGGITPRLIHLNYDSISSSFQMEEAWNALQHPEEHSEKTVADWMAQFEQALNFEDRNITEAKEEEIAKNIRAIWEETRPVQHKADLITLQKMDKYLSQLIQLNEQGMFRFAAESESMSRRAFWLSIILFLIATIVAFYLADNLGVKIATPLKELAETLRRKPIPGASLKLPQATSLEMRILIHELQRLWERLSGLQKLNLDEIASQQKKLEAILASVDDAILVLDNQDQVVHCNPGMIALIQLDQDQILGEKWVDLPSMNNNYLKLRNLLTPQVSSEQTVDLDVNKNQRTFSGRCRAFHDEKGGQLGILYLLHDITETRHRDRLKAQFIDVLSHELKAPLQSLEAAAKTIYQQRDTFAEEAKACVDTLYEDTRRIRAVANEFIQVSVDFHSMKVHLEKISMEDSLVKWIQPFELLAKDRQIKLDFVKEGSETIFGKVDTVKFPWAISNLISNAIRVSPRGGTILVYLTDRENRIDIEVRDEGPGIPDEIQERIFDPFFQGKVGPKGFLGLGLTIAKEVVESHDGRIEYFPRKPTGSIFRVSLPLPFEEE